MGIRTSTILAGLALWPVLAIGQVPSYHPEYLGTFAPGRINEAGWIIGTSSIGGNQRGFIAGSGHPVQYLPLPNGMVSSQAIDLNEQGVIVGAVSAYSSPEFFGRAVAWDPDGAGGYTPRLLGALPGQTISRAMAVNNLGDIVGYSSDGTYRYPVLFTVGGGVQNLSSTGVFDPVDINDQRVLVDHSFTTKRLDLDTMVAEDLGVPPGSFLATTGAAINAAGQVGGLAILTTSGDCDRVTARYTDGVGWEVFSACGQYNGVSDMNEQGDLIMRVGLTCVVRFDGLGSFPVEDLIANNVGHWYVSVLSGMTMNSAGQIAVFATNQVTGQSGTILLTPEGATEGADPVGSDTAAAGELFSHPNPFRSATGIHYELPHGSSVSLLVLDPAGRTVRRLIEGAWQGAGAHQIQWDGRDDNGREVSSGFYAVRLVAGGPPRVGGVVRLR